MRYWLGPWVKTTDDGMVGFTPPKGAIGLIDLRNAFGGYGFFTTPDEIILSSDYTAFGKGHLSELSGDKTMWGSMLNISTLEGTTVLDWLWNTLTIHADPKGETHPAPLMPTSKNILNLHLGGHSLVRSKPFNISMPEAAPVIERKQTQYRQYRQLARDGKLNSDPDFHRRILDMWGEKYKLDNPEDIFIPSDLPREARLLHRTSVSDDFNRSNENLEVSANWSLLGSGSGTPSLVVNSNRCREDSISPSASYGQHQTALSSDDHFAEIDIEVLTAPSSTRSYGASNTRMSDNGSAELNSYTYEATITSASATLGRLKKFTGAGPTATVLADESETINLGDTIRVESDGSDITGKINGVITAGPVTDTSLSGELNTGLGSRIQQGSVGDIELDNFAGADLAAPAVGLFKLVGEGGLAGQGSQLIGAGGLA